MISLIHFTTAIIAIAPGLHGFETPTTTSPRRSIHNLALDVDGFAPSKEGDSSGLSRKSFFHKSTALVISGAIMPNSALAEDKPVTVWMSGKAPIVPGQKPKDKNDVSGTRKDPNFLRSISDCKSQCENANGPMKTKEECLSECQDICCNTYEQCTFAIVPRL